MTTIKQNVEEIITKLQLTVGRIHENRILCTAYLGDFPVADGFSNYVSGEDFTEQSAQEAAKKNCLKNAEARLWELEAYTASRSSNISPLDNNK